MTPVVDAYTGGHQGMILDVYGDKLVFHRHSFSYGEPMGADWVVPFPARPASPFDPVRRKAAATAPQFAAGAEITVEAGRWKTRSKKEADGFKVSFPLAQGKGEFRKLGILARNFIISRLAVCHNANHIVGRGRAVANQQIEGIFYT